MKILQRTWMLLGVFWLASIAIAQESPSATEGAITLEHKTQRSWSFKLPEAQWKPVGTAVEIWGTRFPAKMSGTALELDTDGDGAVDVKVDAEEAVLTLKSGAARYAVRVKNEAGWKFQSTGIMKGSLHGTPIRLLDQNNNGSFADFGEDAMILGHGDVASYLSHTVCVDGVLLEIDVTTAGDRLTFKPWTEAVGQIRLEYDTKAKVLGAVIKSTNGRHSFDLTNAREGIKVPAGTYDIVGGELGLGENRVMFSKGRSRRIIVEAEQATPVGFGGPVTAEFDYARDAIQVVLSPDHVRYFGAVGEQYVSWAPLGKSPKFVIYNRKTGREIAQAYFPGSC